MMTKEQLADGGRETCRYVHQCENINVWQCSECHIEWQFEAEDPFFNGVHYCFGCGRYVETISERYYDWKKDDYVERTITRKEWEAGGK